MTGNKKSIAGINKEKPQKAKYILYQLIILGVLQLLNWIPLQANFFLNKEENQIQYQMICSKTKKMKEGKQRLNAKA